MDAVGMQGGRKGGDAHVFECPIQLADEFNLLFCHWDKVDLRVDLGGIKPEGYICTFTRRVGCGWIVGPTGAN